MQIYNDFHKNHVFLSYIKEKMGRRRKEKSKRVWGEDKKKKKGQDRQEKYFFFPICKKEGNCEVSANSVIN